MQINNKQQLKAVVNCIKKMASINNNELLTKTLFEYPHMSGQLHLIGSWQPVLKSEREQLMIQQLFKHMIFTS
jgi:hypothetical protein